MLSQWFIMLPEILLLLFVVTAGLIDRCREEKTPKTFFTTAQFFIIAVILMTVLFYNKSAFPLFYINTPFTTLFKTCAYLLAWGWLYLSSKWFLNKNRPSAIFCSLVFIQLLLFDILASSVSFLTLAIVIPFIFLTNWLLIRRHWDIDKVRLIALRYCYTSLFFIIVLWTGIALIYHLSGSFDYAEVQKYLSLQQDNNISVLLALSLLISVFIFLLGLAPFHIWFINFISYGVLPVCGFISLIPTLFYLCAFINLIKEALWPFNDFIAPIMMFCGILSVILGTISASGENNLRRWAAYMNIYCIGFAVVGIGNFSSASQIASFAFVIISLLSFAGVYTVFLGLKSHSEYLSELDSIKGFSSFRPYMSAALMIFMFSFIGLAPALGFLGYMSIINNLVVSSDWLRLSFLIIGLLLAVKACLDIIRAVYFEKTAQSYDRPDKSIYICLFINMAVILLSLFNPNWLMQNAVIVLGGNI